MQSQVRFNSGEGSGEGLGGFGAEPGQVQQGSGEKATEKAWEILGVKFNRVLEKVLEKVLGIFGAEPGQVQQGSGEGSGEGSRKPRCKAKSGSTGFRRRSQGRPRRRF